MLPIRLFFKPSQLVPCRFSPDLPPREDFDEKPSTCFVVKVGVEKKPKVKAVLFRAQNASSKNGRAAEGSMLTPCRPTDDSFFGLRVMATVAHRRLAPTSSATIDT